VGTSPHLKNAGIKQLLCVAYGFVIAAAAYDFWRSLDLIGVSQCMDFIFRHMALPILGESVTELSATDA
jgi:hypothetical protein